ncbi:MAG: inorganic diphosphatase [Longimicrobiales bacterium]
MPRHFLREVEHFFAIYKEREGAQTRLTGWRDRDVARTMILFARAHYNEAHGIGPLLMRHK